MARIICEHMVDELAILSFYHAVACDQFVDFPAIGEFEIDAQFALKSLIGPNGMAQAAE